MLGLSRQREHLVLEGPLIVAGLLLPEEPRETAMKEAISSLFSLAEATSMPMKNLGLKHYVAPGT